MEKVFLAKKSEIERGQKKKFKFGLKEILVINLSGKYYAISNKCTHANASLMAGRICKDTQIECPWHGARFDIATGEVKSLPAPIALKTYKLEVEDDEIYLIKENEL